LLVPTTIDLPLLHVTLLFGMGWQGGHIHEFVIGRENYGPTDMAELEHIVDQENVTLRDALGAKKTFTYIYDYGDDWRHKVKVEKIVTLENPIDTGRCIGGENACPPEDVGGPPGYAEFLAALADPEHPEHRDLTEWIGGSFDPTAFSVAEVNERLTSTE
jgi:Plasmid pRiA4b ORF-3-like protein